MPEGPEVRREADKLHRALAGGAALRVFFAFEHLRPVGRRLAGQKVRGVTSHGKAMLTRFEDGTILYTHNQLYGRWMIRDCGDRPKTGRQLRLAIDGQRKSALLYSASTIEALWPDDLADHPFLSKLGPDVLDLSSMTTVRERLQDKSFRGRSLGALYLDQSFLAGLGNYLRSEILFVAGVRPEKTPKQLSTAALTRLARATLRITRRAYETGGITNLPSVARRLKRQGVKRRAYRHFVFAREGQPCRQCGRPVARMESAGRRLYLCVACQT